MKYKAALKADVIFYSNTHTMMHIFLRLCLSLRFILNNIILFKHLNNFLLFGNTIYVHFLPWTVPGGRSPQLTQKGNHELHYY